MTPHINANDLDIKELVIMPGDPLRAKFIAEKYLTDCRLVNDVRLALAYTGKYNGKDVTVMASGMGMPSMGIYAYELFNNYNVKKIIRVGSCGALDENINIKDIIVAQSAYTSSNFAYQYNGKEQNLISASLSLNNNILEQAKSNNISIRVGTVNTSDLFYHEFNDENIKKNNCLATEMECFGLFYIASILKKDASAILTVSDNIVTKEEMTSKEREQTFDTAIKLALDTIIK